MAGLAKYICCPGDVYAEWTVLKTEGIKSYCCCSCGRTEIWKFNYELHGRHHKQCRLCRLNARGSNFQWRHCFPRKIVKAVTGAIVRCTDSNSTGYKHWGGRGISVCKRWLKQPALFCRYLMCLKGSDDVNLVLDRIDNDGNYESGNLRWTTRSVSLSNRRRYKKRPHTQEAKDRIAASMRAAWNKKRAKL